MAVSPKNAMREVVVDCLSQQIDEYELLKSMYPNQGEINLSDKDNVNEIRSFIDNKTDYIPPHLDFKLNLLVDGLKLEIFINLPSS
ncbi:hypothetical protein HF086_015071 [Spodoptera exigua]|nr:hypothetical protein HF086_015071 [Spodoptera exigua]